MFKTNSQISLPQCQALRMISTSDKLCNTLTRHVTPKWAPKPGSFTVGSPTCLDMCVPYCWFGRGFLNWIYINTYDIYLFLWYLYNPVLYLLIISITVSELIVRAAYIILMITGWSPSESPAMVDNCRYWPWHTVAHFPRVVQSRPPRSTIRKGWMTFGSSTSPACHQILEVNGRAHVPNSPRHVRCWVLSNQGVLPKPHTQTW